MLKRPSSEAGLSRRRHFFQSLGRHLAIIALFAQVMAPFALAAHPGLNVAGVLCAPLETLSDEARAEAGALLSDLLGEQSGDNPDTAHCPFCVLAHGVPLPEHHAAPLIFVGHLEVKARSFEASVVCRPQGPPLGLRAPPSISL